MSESVNPTHTGVLELNDYQIRLTVGAHCYQSSGYATIVSDGLLFGRLAQQQARRQPLVSYQQYWNQLNLEPLQTNDPKLRHYADFAHQQLLDLYQQAGEQLSEVILAVPASFNREQLALLLGVCQQCPFEVIGLIDSSVAALGTITTPGHYVYIDIQLHQCLISEIQVGSNIQLINAEIVPGTGVVQLYQHFARYLTTQFIEQCRFDPKHDADSEQQLYDLLEQLIGEEQYIEERHLNLEGKQVTLDRQSLFRHASGIFDPVLAVLDKQQPGVRIYVSQRVAQISELYRSLSAKYPLKLIDVQTLSEQCLAQKQIFKASENGVHYTTSLALSKSQPQQQPTGSHLLWQNAAYPIGKQALYILNHENLILSHENHNEAQFSIVKEPHQLTLNKLNGSGILVNQQPASDGMALKLGDSLSFSNHPDTLTLINVINDEPIL